VVRDKGLEVALGDPQGTPKPMGYQFAGFDPPTNRAGADPEILRHMSDNPAAYGRKFH
jgi:hypothetical protein